MLVTGRSLTLIVKHEKKSLGSFADIKLLSHPDDCRKPLSLKCLFTISLSMSLCSFFILALFCLHLCCLLSLPPFLAALLSPLFPICLWQGYENRRNELARQKGKDPKSNSASCVWLEIGNGFDPIQNYVPDGDQS